MNDFTGKDPRGKTVLLKAGVWIRHAVPGHPILVDQYESAVLTLTDPDEILDNVPKPGMPQRVGHERYVKFIPALGQRLVIPAKVLTAAENYPPIGIIAADTRDVVTIHPTTGIVSGKKVWP